MSFDREKFEKELIKEILGVKDKLEYEYGVKFSIDVVWVISPGVESHRGHTAM